jgi:hypothetical protein
MGYSFLWSKNLVDQNVLNLDLPLMFSFLLPRVTSLSTQDIELAYLKDICVRVCAWAFNLSYCLRHLANGPGLRTRRFYEHQCPKARVCKTWTLINVYRFPLKWNAWRGSLLPLNATWRPCSIATLLLDDMTQYSPVLFFNKLH